MSWAFCVFSKTSVREARVLAIFTLGVRPLNRRRAGAALRLLGPRSPGRRAISRFRTLCGEFSECFGNRGCRGRARRLSTASKYKFVAILDTVALELHNYELLAIQHHSAGRNPETS